MSACLFMQTINYLTDEELENKKRELISFLGSNDLPKEKSFESDRWHGLEHTLGSIYIEQHKRYEDSYNKHVKNNT